MRGLRHTLDPRPEHALGGDRGRQRVPSWKRPGCDECTWIWPVRTLADHEVAQEAPVSRAVEGRKPFLGAPLADRLSDLVDALRGQHVASQIIDQVPPGGVVKPELQLAVFGRAEGVLDLVAVAQLLDHRHDRFPPVGLGSGRPDQRIAHLALLLLQLNPVGQHLPRRSWMREAGLSMRSGLGSMISTRAPRRRTAWPSRSALVHGRPAPPPRTNRTNPPHARRRLAVGERVDGDHDLLALAGSRTLRCGGAGHADYARRLHMPTDLAAYRAEAEDFLSSIDREYYLHYSGSRTTSRSSHLRPSQGLFSREAVTGLREVDAPRALSSSPSKA